MRQLLQLLAMGAHCLRRYPPANARQKQRQQIQHRQLRREALRCRNRDLPPRHRRQRRIRLTRHRRIRIVHDRHRSQPARLRLAQRRQRVRRLARLRNHHHARIMQRVRRAIHVFARVLHIHGQPGVILQHDLASQPSMPARSTGRNHHALPAAQRLGNRTKDARVQCSARSVARHRRRQCLRLLVDLPQHGVRKSACRLHICFDLSGTQTRVRAAQPHVS